jgi:hypothetical protein
MYDEIRREVHEAARYGRKSAMFHYQVLKNADALAHVHPKDFCDMIGMPASYATEFSKMINLAALIKEKGL